MIFLCSGVKHFKYQFPWFGTKITIDLIKTASLTFHNSFLGYLDRLATRERYIIHHHYKEVITTDTETSSHLGNILDKLEIEISDTVRVFRKTRTVLSERMKSDSESQKLLYVYRDRREGKSFCSGRVKNCIEAVLTV